MRPNESRQLRTTMIFGNSPFDSSIFKHLFGPKRQEGQSQVSLLFDDVENEHKWPRLTDSRVGNGEQWKLFD